jgi:hypothetical protein
VAEVDLVSCAVRGIVRYHGVCILPPGIETPTRSPTLWGLAGLRPVYQMKASGRLPPASLSISLRLFRLALFTIEQTSDWK